MRPPLLPLLALLALAGPAVRADDPDPDLTVEARVGLAGLRAPDRWTPVRLRVANRGPDLRGELRLVPIDTLEEWPPNILAVDLPRGANKVYWMYARLPSYGPVRATLRAKGRWRSAEFELPPVTDDLHVAVIGTAAGIPPGLTAMSTPRDRVSVVDPEDLPDRWVGYDAIEWIVVAQADSSVFPTPPQAEAFANWVRSGGRCAVVASQGGGAVRGTVFESILPATLGETREIASAETLGGWLRTDPPEATPFVASMPTSIERCKALVEGEDRLVLRGRAGLGEVLLLTFDPRAAPFRSWKGIETLWPFLYHGGPPPKSVEPNPYNAWGTTEPVSALLEGFPVANPVSFGWLALLYGLYVLVLWPVDWWILRRLRRPGWMWGTMLFWVALFGAVVYAVSTRGRGKTLSLRRITVMDADGGEGWIAGRTFAALYTPRAGAFDFAGPDGEAFVTHFSGMTNDRRDRGGTSRGGAAEQGNGVALRGVWMWSAMMKHFEMAWRAGPEAGFGVKARVVGDMLEVEGGPKYGIEGLTLVSKESVWELEGGVSPKEKRWLAIGAGTNRKGWVNNQPHLYNYAYRSWSEDPDWDSYAPTVRQSLYASFARVEDGDPSAVPPSTLFGRDLNAWLEAGGRVLFASVARPPVGIRVTGENPEMLDVCVVRILIE